MFHATGLTGWQRAAGDAAEAAAATSTPKGTEPAPAGPGEFEALKAQAESVAAALEAIRRRIDQLGDLEQDH